MIDHENKAKHPSTYITQSLLCLCYLDHLGIWDCSWIPRFSLLIGSIVSILQNENYITTYLRPCFSTQAADLTGKKRNHTVLWK